MTYLTRATLVRAAVEHAALNAGLRAAITSEREDGSSALTNSADTRFTLRTAFRELSERRRERATSQALVRKLATYTTPAEIQDILGTIEGQEGSDAEKIRSILAGKPLRQGSHPLASFRPLSQSEFPAPSVRICDAGREMRPSRRV